MKNVVLFTIDTLRRDVFGCYGNAEGLTPFFDSIKDHLMVFDNVYSVGPYTQAAFPGILASGYYMDLSKNPQPVLSPKRLLISESLKKKGIFTAAFHSNPYMSDFFGWKRGWSTFYDGLLGQVDVKYPYMRANVINEKVKSWMDEYLGEGDYDPFFLWMHYMDVHEPYIPDQEYRLQVSPELADLTSDEMYEMYQNTVIPRNVSNLETVNTLRSLYKAHVCEIDQNARHFFKMLKENGILEDTIVIITADHGDEFNDHGSLSHDGKFFDELVHVPFMIFDTDIQGLQHVDTLISNINIPPTILNFFGFENEEKFLGKSIFPLENFKSDGVYGEAIGKLKHQTKPTDKPAYYFTDGHYKVTYYEEGDMYSIYDIVNDPKEQNDVVDSFENSQKYKDIIINFAKRTNK